MNVFKKNKGFSIVELLVVMAIIAIITFIAAPSISKYIKQAQDQGVDTAAATIQTVTRAKLRELDGRTDIPKTIYAEGSNLYNEIFKGSTLSNLDSKLYINTYDYKTLPTIASVQTAIKPTANYDTWAVYLPNHTLSTDTDNTKFNLDLNYPIIIFCLRNGEPPLVYNDGLNVTATYAH